jgi:hypothetical protein
VIVALKNARISPASPVLFQSNNHSNLKAI